MTKVSVCIPIYNVESFIERCARSLFDQTIDDIEYIFVNDCTPDGSVGVLQRVLEEYPHRKKQVKILHNKENRGSAVARQLGLDCCTGEYYTVCDSDDWVEPDMYERLYEKAYACDADIVLSGTYVNYPNGGQDEISIYKYTNQEQYILDIMYAKASPNTWNKLFRVDTIRTHDISFVAGIDLGEDVLFLYKLLLIGNLKIVSVNGSFYHYYRNGGSYTHNITLKTLKNSEYILKWRQEHFRGGQYERANQLYAINVAVRSLRTVDITKEYFNQLAEKISITNIIKYRLISVKTLTFIAIKIFGFNFCKFMYRHVTNNKLNMDYKKSF